jgi:hypothetical protein
LEYFFHRYPCYEIEHGVYTENQWLMRQVSPVICSDEENLSGNRGKSR